MNSVLQGGLSRRLVTGLNVAGRSGPNMPGRAMAVGLPAAAAAAAAARNAGPPGDRGLAAPRPLACMGATGDSRPAGARRAVGLCLLAHLTDGSSGCGR